MKKIMRTLTAMVLALCMVVPMLAQSAAAADQRTYIAMSITDGEKLIEDHSSQYLTAESSLLMEIGQIVNANWGEMARKYQSPAMMKLLEEGMQARRDADKWARYTEKMAKNITNEDGLQQIMENVDCTLGDLELGKEYSISYYNDVKSDFGYDSTYTVTVVRHRSCPGQHRFDDVPETYWAYCEIEFVASKGLFNGTATRIFSPRVDMSRQMLMTVLARLNGADTSETPYAKGMAWAVANGVSDGTRPTESITRQQMAAMLYRDSGEPTVTVDLGRFPDAASVTEYARAAMTWAVQSGIINGTDDGLLDPHGHATRAQVAAMLARYCGRFE